MGWLRSKQEGEIGEILEYPQYSSFNRFANLSKNPKSSTSYIRMMDFNSLEDVDMIKEELNERNVMILNVNNLLNSNNNSILELKRAIDQLRGYCRQLGGSIGRIGENLLIVTPNSDIRLG